MKVAFIIEKPRNCGVCKVLEVCPVVWKYGYGFYSIEDVEDNDVIGVDTNGVCEECPLRPVPEKKMIGYEGYIDEREAYETEYRNGWNDCLNEIVGEEE